ncbi:Monooxygenase FAD-binding [Penicillium sp. DV-2018c]|nr:Monooxygenase FAD-binding [Penicillium sp. DV-2018c]KAJ5567635.1 Monooxygenase FAD-binding [Penicillium sp. DV-2018c]
MRSISRAVLRPYVCPTCRHGTGAARRRFASKSDSLDIYDVVCVGGGPAGLGLLAALRSSPITSKLKVALIESQDLSKAKAWNLEPTQFSNRVSSLTPSTVSFLRSIGAYDHLDTSRVQEYHDMQVWDGQTGSRITFDWSMETSPFEDPRTVATMTENANLVRALLRRIADSGDENLSLFSNSTVAAIENGSDLASEEGPNLSAWPIVTVKPTSPTETTAAPKRIAARLLVGADGINSPVRSFADIPTQGWDYGRHGIVATLSLAEPASPPFPATKRTAYQRFLPSLGGPIALLPLPNNHATLVWSTTPENAAYLKSLPAQSFLAMVNAAFRLDMTDLSYMLTLPSSSSSSSSSTDSTTSPTPSHQDELTWRTQHTPLPAQIPPPATSVQPGTIASFPLRFRHAAQYISPRVALVGDAAHVIHPLAGQGLNLGLADVASLSRTIQYAVSHGMDVGDLLTLERYSCERYLPNAKIGGACDLLHKMYNVPGEGPITWARSLGLGVVDRLPFVKGFLMRNAEGY